MSDTMAGLLQLGALLIALAVLWKYLGDWMYRSVTATKHSRIEKVLYRVIGVNPDAEQRWTVYLRGLLAFAFLGIVAVFALQRLQAHLPYNLGFEAVPADQAVNTAVSFVTNTNWQSYSGEATMSHLTQMAGLAVQNFLSAAVGITVAVALIRGLIRSKTDRLGNFWVDLTRITLRVLLPVATVGAIVLLASGVIQNLSDPHTVHTLAGNDQQIPNGPIASQESIKELGTNGGGPFNANSAHPYENPNAFSNWFEILLLLAIPVALTRTFGRFVGMKQGLAVLAAIAVVFSASLTGMWIAESHATGQAAVAADGNMEGKETRFGTPASVLFATATTSTSTGAVNSFHDSYSPLGGGLAMLNMLFGEITPGGVGSGLYGIVIISILAVFLCGLMVGRTPEYLGKKITGAEMKLVALYILVTPAVVLIGTAVAMKWPGATDSILPGNNGAHGFSEILYAFTSAGNNNGSAFGGLNANTPFYNYALALAMLVGRFVPIVLVIALAGRLAAQGKTPTSAGTLPTGKPLFVGILVATILIVTALTYVPALALGPIAEGLS